MARYDLRNFVLNVAEECDVTDERFMRSCEPLARFEDPFLATVSKKQSPTLVGCWEDDHEEPEHLLALRSIDVRLEE
jgi:hypothetical protein